MKQGGFAGALGAGLASGMVGIGVLTLTRSPVAGAVAVVVCAILFAVLDSAEKRA